MEKEIKEERLASAKALEDKGKPAGAVKVAEEKMESVFKDKEGVQKKGGKKGWMKKMLHY